MTSKLSVEDIISRNKRYAAKLHKPLPLLYGPDGKPKGGSGFLVVTCVDPRIIPEIFLGFRLPGLSPLAIPVIRVIGGRAIHAYGNIVALDAVFGIHTVLLIHHTDCGLTHNTDESIKTTLKERFPEDLANIDQMTIGAIDKLGQSVADDVEFLKQSPMIKKEMDIQGFVYHIDTGLLEHVK